MSKNERSKEEYSVFVGSLPSYATEGQLIKRFTRFGSVIGFKINYDWNNGTFTIM